MKMRGVRNDAIVTTIASRGIYDKKEAEIRRSQSNIQRKIQTKCYLI